MGGNKDKPGVAIIAGMASGFGEAVARELIQARYPVIGISRTAKEECVFSIQPETSAYYTHYVCDVSDEEQVANTFKDIEANHGDPSVVIYNAMFLTMKPFMELLPEEFERSWLSTCFGAMIIAKAAIKSMLACGGGTVIFSGATAAIKGSPGFAAFASAKFALRGLAQSLAREFGPQGIHVVNVLIDGLIWGPQTQERFKITKEHCLEPDAIAKTYLQLIDQPSCAWTHELDLRPSTEKF